MTDFEAANLLLNSKPTGTNAASLMLCEAIDKAVRLLKNSSLDMTDLISRKEVLYEIDKVPNKDDWYRLTDVMKMVQHVPAAQLVDAISKERVMDVLAHRLSDYLTDETREELENLSVTVEEMPLVLPKGKTGTWKLSEDKEHGKCPFCGAGWFDLVGGQIYIYCPECGANLTDDTGTN